MTLIATLACTAALGQGFDGTGLSSPPDGSTVRDALGGWSGRFPGAPTLGLTGWAADEPLVRRITDGTEIADHPILDDLFGVSLQGLAPISQRFAVALDVPIWLGSAGDAAGGVAPGDITAHVPVRLYDRGGPRLLLIPEIGVPTGATARYLGEPGPTFGVVASGGIDLGPLTTALDLGAEAGLATDVPDWPGGLTGRFDLDVGVVPVDSVGLHAELRGQGPIGRDIPGVPVEFLGSVRIRPVDRLLLTAGGGAGVVRGVGAAALRLGVGMRTALGKQAVEVAPVELADATELHVVDERRWPIRGAVAVVGGSKAETDDEGYADLPARTGRIGRIDVSAPGFEATTLDVGEDRTWWEVVLKRVPVPVAVSVVGPEGALDDAVVKVTGEDQPVSDEIDTAGVHQLLLRPGTWLVEVSAPGMGAQERTLVIEPSRTEPIRVDAVLSPIASPDTVLSVKVVDRNGVPVEDAVVAIGDRDLGTTGTSGDLVVHGLADGETEIVVRSPRIGQSTLVVTDIVPGTNEVEAILEWPAGSVLVTVHDAKGRPVDARVAFAGPAPLPSRAVGSDGEELFVLRPGGWDLLLSAATLGTQQRHVEVGDRPGEVVEVDVVMVGEEKGAADLSLTVQDVDGRPVQGARVLVDGEPVGSTGTDGGLALFELTEGLRYVEVEGDLLVPLAVELELVAGRQSEELVVWSTTGAITISAHDDTGRPLDAVVGFIGSQPIPALPLGPDGEETTVLLPGAWDVAVSHPDFGTRSQRVVIAEQDRRRHVLDVTLAPVVEELARLELLVHGPDGAALDAAVSLDGAEAGSTTDGKLVVDGLPVGPMEVGVIADAMLPEQRTVDLPDQVDFTLQWAPGALEVEVIGPDGPIDAALVALAGTRPLASRQTVDGTVRFNAAPGTWWVMASHPKYAIAEKQIEIPAIPELAKVRLVLAEVDKTDAQLVVSVRDEEGRPLEGVAVLVDGEKVGETSGGGTFSLVGRPEGDATVTLQPDPLHESAQIPVKLDRGDQDRHTVVLPWAASEVSVDVAGGTSGEVRAYGPNAQVIDAKVDDDGKATLALPPGQWTVVATSPGNAGSALVTVEAGQPAAASIEMFETGTTLQDGKVRLVHPILFDVGRYELRPEALQLLDDVARRLTVDRRAALVEIQGHTSDEGGVAYNQQLSESRARAVREALVARGVEPERLISRGYGLSRPMSQGHDESARQQNRRVELVVVDQSTP
ncbi:MAG: OmpA family protein [Alphaproteobacteria bacterium]|nr:OmpA family protein [Alphaproteobacteria bacterium]MCB9695171.1 OmpA family protein [Alphaproteobacteria bacterium]